MNRDDTLGGYVETHGCPPAFSGKDGISYTAEIVVDRDPDEAEAFGAALMFVRWSQRNQKPDGHLETPYLVHGATHEDAKASIEGFSLRKVKELLDLLIEKQRELPTW